MITALLFDFGGTLDGPSHWLDRFLAEYRAAGLDLARDELDCAFESATRNGYRAGRVLQRFSLAELVRFLAGHQVEFLVQSGPERIRGSLAAEGPKGRYRIVERISAAFVEETRRGLEHSRAVLKELKVQYRIGVVSNFYGNLDRVLADSSLAALVDAVIDSSRVAMFKPEPGIFDAALRALGVPAPEAAMVGDSLEKDCAPAHRLGLRTVWFRPQAAGIDAGRSASASADVVDFAIGDLAGLKQIQW